MFELHIILSKEIKNFPIEAGTEVRSDKISHILQNPFSLDAYNVQMMGVDVKFLIANRTPNASSSYTL